MPEGIEKADPSLLRAPIGVKLSAMGKDAIEMNGVIKECFTNHFKVTCDNGHEVVAYLAGKMRRFYIKVMPGDRVIVEISPYDLTRGRITKRVAAGGQIESA